MSTTKESTQNHWGNAQRITTQDGSHTLWLPDLQETYHSTHGAIQESRHVFIQHGLAYWLEKQPQAPIHILEVGLGTGLNTLLSYAASLPTQTRINYVGLEPFSIAWEQAQGLNYVSQLAQEEDCVIEEARLQTVFEQIHQLPATATTQLAGHFSLQKHQLTLQEFTPPLHRFDIVYFDAFAPSKQEQMWTLDLLHKVCGMMKSTGVLVTYCAQGKFRRNLKELGMQVETLPGPPGKKEMTRAWKTEETSFKDSLIAGRG